MEIIKKSFGDWCIENDRYDLLDRWDYELNERTPFEIGKSSNQKWWFKCPHGIHESGLKSVNPITNKSINKKDLVCSKCNSIGQFIIDKHGEDYLEQIWSSKNNMSPFEISVGSGKKIWLKCLSDVTHPDYEQICCNFSKGHGCPYCTGRKVCFTNSLGYKYPEIINKWSDKNEKTPYDYAYGSNTKVWFKCEKGIHKDYQRKICAEIAYKMMCPSCGRENQEYNGGGALKKPEDLTGQKFGRLTVLYHIRKGKRNAVYWVCKCDCGETKEVLASHLKSGKIQSCGCLWKESISGENNKNWRGGTTTELVKARHSLEYKEWQKEVYKKDWYTCQCCGKKRDLRAHHILNFSDNIDLRYDIENGITLCNDCHDIKGEVKSFHNLYGTKKNTPEQLEEYINNRRKQLGIEESFSIEEYKNGKIMKPSNKN